jgi:hypothetical protein
MKLNDIDFDKLTDNELKGICLKYKIIDPQKINLCQRSKLLEIIKKWLEYKLKNYGQRRNSINGNLQKNQLNYSKSSGPPKPEYDNRQRRLSQPITSNEVSNANTVHQQNQIRQQAEQINQQNIMNNKYDIIGMYPAQKKLVAIGDLHGDLIATLKVLKLAEVIPQNTTINNIANVQWTGGDTWVIQLGDQIDRCRPDDWVQNCLKDLTDVYEDEGNNMLIFKLFLRLDDEAKKYGGRVLGLLGNHELMNVDKDFRYVSPKEFLEFVPEKDRTSKYTKDGFPLGYYHRTKAFERGGNIAKTYSIKKKSIMTIGSYLFVHGGMSIDLAKKYSIAEINQIVAKWLLKQDSEQETKIFDEIFRDDDDMSPFWCRIFSEEEGEDENTLENFNKLINNINQKNKLLKPIKGMVVAHTPQFMDNKYLNGIYDKRLWRIDVGMSRAFGKQDDCGENKYRMPQILIIHNDSQFEVRKISFNSDRPPAPNNGEKVNIHNMSMPF